jgi:hypothetical protein
VGEVIGAVGEWDAARANIHTRVELSVAELLKGAASSPVTFTQLGGRVGGEASAVAGAVAFQPGERVLVFLTRRPDGSLGLTDLSHGAFSLARDVATGRDHALGAAGADRFELDHVRTRIRRALDGRG